MPFRYSDLSGGGRHLNVTTMTQIAPFSAGLVNTQGAIGVTTASPTAPGIHYVDSAGFFAPVFGSADEAMSFVLAVNIVGGAASNIFLGWGDPSNSVGGWFIQLDATEIFNARTYNAAGGQYNDCYINAAISNGTHLFHVEFRTGSAREINIWLDSVQTAQTKAGPSGTAYVRNGNEILVANARHNNTIGNTQHGLGVIGFRRGRFTNAERVAHLIALNTI